MFIQIGPYDKKKASALKIQSGNFPGHGKIPPPPEGARIGYGLYDDREWVGFVELTYPFQKGIDKTKAYAGVGISKKYRGQGIAEKAVKLLKRLHPNIKTWLWTYLKTNKASANLGKKLGYIEKKTGRFNTMEKTASFSALEQYLRSGH